MFRFNFNVVPPTVEAAADFLPRLNQLGTWTTGVVLGSIMLANTGDYGLSERVSEEFIQNNVHNPGMISNFMEGVYTALTPPEEGRLS